MKGILTFLLLLVCCCVTVVHTQSAFVTSNGSPLLIEITGGWFEIGIGHQPFNSPFHLRVFDNTTGAPHSNKMVNMTFNSFGDFVIGQSSKITNFNGEVEFTLKGGSVLSNGIGFVFCVILVDITTQFIPFSVQNAIQWKAGAPKEIVQLFDNTEANIFPNSIVNAQGFEISDGFGNFCLNMSLQLEVIFGASGAGATFPDGSSKQTIFITETGNPTNFDALLANDKFGSFTLKASVVENPTISLSKTFQIIGGSPVVQANEVVAVAASISAIAFAVALIVVIIVVLVVRRRSKNKQKKSTWDKVLIAYDDLQFGETLGEGAFGVVVKGTWRNADCVIKKLKNADKVDELVVEAKKMIALRPHPNVVQFLGISRDPEKPVCLVLEYVSGGNLLSFLKKITLTESLIYDMFLDIANGMLHLHSENIIHCDLAARNILVKKSDDSFVLKISDFGMSAILDEDKKGEEMKETAIPIRWASPEVISTKSFSKASDVWSFGVVMWEILEQSMPYPLLSNKQVLEGVSKEGLKPSKPKSFKISDELWDQMRDCWHKDPAKRSTFAEISEFLRKISKSASDDVIITMSTSEPQPSRQSELAVNYQTLTNE